MFFYIVKKALLNLLPEKYQSAINDQILNKRLIRSLDIKDGHIIFDVGAHNGESIQMFLNSKKKITIHAFEPINKFFKKLRIIYEKKKNIILNNYAITDKIGKYFFFENNHTQTSGFLKLNKNYNYKNYIFETTKKYKVKTLTLDKYCKKNKIKKINLLKIDVQGLEEMVLKGATSLIKRKLIKNILLEIIFCDHYQRTSNFYKIEKLLIKQGFYLKNLSSPAYNSVNSKIDWIDALYSLK